MSSKRTRRRRANRRHTKQQNASKTNSKAGVEPGFGESLLLSAMQNAGDQEAGTNKAPEVEDVTVDPGDDELKNPEQEEPSVPVLSGRQTIVFVECELDLLGEEKSVSRYFYEDKHVIDAVEVAVSTYVLEHVKKGKFPTGEIFASCFTAHGRLGPFAIDVELTVDARSMVSALQHWQKQLLAWQGPEVKSNVRSTLEASAIRLPAELASEESSRNKALGNLHHAVFLSVAEGDLLDADTGSKILREADSHVDSQGILAVHDKYASLDLLSPRSQ